MEFTMPFSILKKAAAVLIVIILLTGAVIPDKACASNVDTRLVVGINSTKTVQILPLDPTERDIMSIYDLVWESLVTIDDDYNPTPCLAESWDVSSNGKTWTFNLRSNVFFSDGTPLTADDVVATAQYILDRANDEASSNKGYYSNLKWFIKSISAKNESTVEIRANRPYYGMLYAVTFPIMKADEVGKENPLGTGPYVITSFDAGANMWLERNQQWWKALPKVQEIMVSFNSTPKQVMESYEYGRVDTIFTRSIAAAQYKSSSSSIALDYRTNQLETILMNNAQTPLDDVMIRKAIRLAISPDKIASDVYLGMVKRADLPVIPGTWMYNDTLDEYFVQNIDEARKIIEEAGWADLDEDGYVDKPDKDGKRKNFTLRLYVYEDPESDVRVETANMISDSLAQIGIKVNITTMEMSELETKLSKGSFDLALASFAMDACPDPGFFLRTGNQQNYGRYKSSVITSEIDKLRTSVDKASFRDNLWAIQQTFAEDCPFICLFYRAGAVLTRKMYTTVRDVRELELLRGIEGFNP